MEIEVTFETDGRAHAIYSDEAAAMLRAVGYTLDTKRASDVEPCGDGWTATMRDWVPGGAVTLGPFKTRDEALKEEVAYLKRAGL